MHIFITFIIFILVLTFFLLFVMGASMDEKKEKIIKKLAVSVPLSTISVIFLLYDVEIIPAVKYMIIFPLVLFSGLLVGWRLKKTDNIERSDD
jgi:hypothetical protein